MHFPFPIIVMRLHIIQHISHSDEQQFFPSNRKSSLRAIGPWKVSHFLVESLAMFIGCFQFAKKKTFHNSIAQKTSKHRTLTIHLEISANSWKMSIKLFAFQLTHFLEHIYVAAWRGGGNCLWNTKNVICELFWGLLQLEILMLNSPPQQLFNAFH